MKRIAVVLLMWTITAFGAEGTKLPGAERYMRCTAIHTVLVDAARQMKPEEEKEHRDQAELYIKYTAWFYPDSPDRFQSEYTEGVNSISSGLKNGELSTDAFAEEVGACYGLLARTTSLFLECMEDRTPTAEAREACTKSAIGLQKPEPN
jgi:hypothetical protein